jgi:transposase
MPWASKPDRRRSQKRNGQSCCMEMPQTCSGRLRTAVYHWARVATQHDGRNRSRYAAPRVRGHSHGRALRPVADRLLGIACVMLAKRTTFDPAPAPTNA